VLGHGADGGELPCTATSGATGDRRLHQPRLACTCQFGQPYRCLMGYRFNPPPNWPEPPPGWTPPPGWLPHPSWPPPPPGWDLWISDDDTASPSSITPLQVPPPATPGSETRPVVRPRRSQHSAGPAAPTQPLLQRVRGRFRTLPMWAKILVILLLIGLLIGLLPWLLIAGGLGLSGIGIVGLLRGSLPRFRVASRASATAALLLGLVGVGTGSALAAAVLTPASPPATTSPPVAAPTTQSVIPTLAPTTPVPRTTVHPPATRPPTTVAPTKPATTRPRATVVPTRSATTRPPKPSPPPSTTKPAPLCGAPANPYGYNFCGRGGCVLDPPADVCAYFDCIRNFWNGTGHMEECQDGTYSMSGGRPGSCSHHGGNLRVVYRGP